MHNGFCLLNCNAKDKQMKLKLVLGVVTVWLLTACTSYQTCEICGFKAVKDRKCEYCGNMQWAENSEIAHEEYIKEKQKEYFYIEGMPLDFEMVEEVTDPFSEKTYKKDKNWKPSISNDEMK